MGIMRTISLLLVSLVVVSGCWGEATPVQEKAHWPKPAVASSPSSLPGYRRRTRFLIRRRTFFASSATNHRPANSWLLSARYPTMARSVRR